MIVGNGIKKTQRDITKNVDEGLVRRYELPDNGGNDKFAGASLFLVSGAEE
jgi:hypothetical protein